MVQTDTIQEELEKLGFPIGKVITDAEYDYFADYFEPTEVYAFKAEDFLELSKQIEHKAPKAGILIAELETESTLYACGVGEYNEIQTSAFKPLHEYF